MAKNNRGYESEWGTDEAQKVTRSQTLAGKPNKSNLDKWAKISTKNSFDQNTSKAQSKRDLAPVKGFHEEETKTPSKSYTNYDQGNPDTGPGLKHYCDLSKKNSFW